MFFAQGNQHETEKVNAVVPFVFSTDVDNPRITRYNKISLKYF
jgi:hypothetical protein